jgi:hypothetical protein
MTTPIRGKSARKEKDMRLNVRSLAYPDGLRIAILIILLVLLMLPLIYLVRKLHARITLRTIVEALCGHGVGGFLHLGQLFLLLHSLMGRND